MNKSAFNELIAYISSRPAEASRLASALGINHEGVRATESSTVGESGSAQSLSDIKFSHRLVSARVAGEAIGKSAKWMKEHLQLFPSACYEKRGEKGKWHFDLEEVKINYNHYIINKTY